MRTHYYFGWFNDTIPSQLSQVLQEDLPVRKSLVMICTNPSNYRDSTEMSGMVKDLWLAPLGIAFDVYHSIDYRVSKEEAQTLVKNASVIFLHGGSPDAQNAFLAEYGLSTAIAQSSATVIMGASAGAMNMAAKYVSSYTGEQVATQWKAQNGLGLDRFALESHSMVSGVEELAQSALVQDGLMPLSTKLDVYVACEESTIRVKNGTTDIMGDVYLISDYSIRKLDETFGL